MTSISIFEFYLLNRLSNQEYNKKLLHLIGFDTTLDKNDKLKETINMCEELGMHGWVICPYWQVDIEKGETVLGTWYDKIVNNKDEEIAHYFQKNNYKLVNDIIGYSIYNIPTYLFLWMSEARSLFFEKKYLSCAMVLTAILEGCIRRCPIESWKRQITKYYESVSKNIENEYLEEDSNLIEKLYDYFYILSSLNKFISCFFDGNKPFELMEEPSYLERNWLMHGMTQKTVSEIDCIKLFNVISSLQFLIDNYNAKNL